MESSHGGSDQWAIYEGNVQAYRGLAVSAQSLFLAVGAFLLEDRVLPFTAVLVFALVATWWVFFPAIFARTAIVDFHKFDLGSRFDHRGHPANAETQRHLSATDYGHVTNWTIRRAVYQRVTEEQRTRFGDAQPAFRTLRLTRLKLDVVLPAMFTAVWIVFGVYVFLV